MLLVASVVIGGKVKGGRFRWVGSVYRDAGAVVGLCGTAVAGAIFECGHLRLEKSLCIRRANRIFTGVDVSVLSVVSLHFPEVIVPAVKVNDASVPVPTWYLIVVLSSSTSSLREVNALS